MKQNCKTYNVFVRSHTTVYMLVKLYFRFLHIKPEDGPKGPKHVAYMKLHSCVWAVFHC